MAQFHTNQNNNPEVSLRRIQVLSDCVFAMSMTLMVLKFDLPDSIKDMTSLEIKNFLLAQIPDLAIYTLSLLLLAYYWTKYIEQYKYYRRTDETHLWLQILLLMGVILIPYGSALYASNFYIQTLNSLILCWIGILFYFNWVYATKNCRLVDADLDRNLIAIAKIKALVEPAIALMAIVAGLISPLFWELTFLLIPVAYVAIDKKYGRSLKKDSRAWH